jgi:hypothetical protein
MIAPILQNRFIVYLITAFLSLLIARYGLNISGHSLQTPLDYQGDTIFAMATIKTMIEQGWYWVNPRLGAPFGMYLYDFPNADFFNFLIVKVISLFFPDSVVVMNVFFLLTFPFTAITSLFTFNYFKIPNLIAVTFALLYAFAPYHFYRGIGHLFLSAYYIIPLITLVVLSLWSRDMPFFCQTLAGKDSYRFDGLSKRSFFYFIICAIAGSTGIYYSFFSCFFIFIAGFAGLLTKPRKYKIILLSSVLLISIILFSSFLNILPSIIYNRTHTPNPEVAKRLANETEVYGLKMVDLLLPTSGLHRISVLQRLGQRYKNQGLPAIQNENVSAYLGVVGGLGFIYLLSIRVFIFRFRANLLIERLSILNIAAFLFATTGGGAVLFALLVTPQLRGINRISIFIHFFALLTVALLLDRFYRVHIQRRKERILFNIVFVAMITFALFEQSVPLKHFSSESRSSIAREYNSERSFVQSIEKVLPPDAMVFQLPHVPFPEHPPVKKMLDYDLFRGYLHSKSLKWSYGAVKGRNSNWHTIVVSQPLERVLNRLVINGFQGLYIDRYGYSDNGQQIQQELESKLGETPIVSPDGRLLFFDLRRFHPDSGDTPPLVPSR